MKLLKLAAISVLLLSAENAFSYVYTTEAQSANGLTTYVQPFSVATSLDPLSTTSAKDMYGSNANPYWYHNSINTSPTKAAADLNTYYPKISSGQYPHGCPAGTTCSPNLYLYLQDISSRDLYFGCTDSSGNYIGAPMSITWTATTNSSKEQAPPLSSSKAKCVPGGYIGNSKTNSSQLQAVVSCSAINGKGAYYFIDEVDCSKIKKQGDSNNVQTTFNLRFAKS